jgi:dephospho-CoA kinase
MVIIGICGSSGSGKSTLCSYFRKKGYRVCDCDALYSQIITPPSDCLEEIASFFGDEVLKADGTLDRKALASIVFSSKEKLDALNNITFSHIKRELLKLVKKAENDKFFFIDAPLLFESGIDKICQKTLCIIAPIEKKISRLQERDKLSMSAVSKRLNSQINDEILVRYCDDVIINDSDLSSLYDKADVYLEKLTVVDDEGL